MAAFDEGKPEMENSLLRNVCFECPVCIREAFHTKHDEETKLVLKNRLETQNVLKYFERDIATEKMLVKKLLFKNLSQKQRGGKMVDTAVQCDLERSTENRKSDNIFLYCYQTPAEIVRGKMSEALNDPFVSVEEKTYLIENALSSLRSASRKQLIREAFENKDEDYVHFPDYEDIDVLPCKSKHA